MSASSTEDRAVKRARTEGPTSSGGITERDVGISEFISSTGGFSGTLKQRYTDFLVNEIDVEGKVVHLVDLGLIDKRERRRDRREQERLAKGNAGEEVSEETQDQEKEKPDQEREKQERQHVELSEEQRSKVVQLLGDSTVDQILELFQTGSKLETEQSFDSKDTRTKIHQTLRECFNGRLETKTTAENKFIITLATSNSRGGSGRGSKLDKSNLGPSKDFLHFVMYKENKETMEVANLLSKFLRIPPKNVAYAGTKDRRGVTVQNMCINRIAVERVNGLNKILRGIKLGSFTYSNDRIKLGQLKGNEFVITIRNVVSNGDQQDTQSNVDRCLISLREKGFINYYGMQRFGTFSISTHEVGKQVLQSEWENVVKMLLSPQELSLEESRKAREQWQANHDAAQALADMPRKCIAEYSILRSLAKDQENGAKYSYANAVMQIPRNLRVMYAHAYQSYVWNTVTSKRVAKYGLQVVPGDLVFDNNQEVDDDVEDIEADASSQGQKFAQVRPVTSEEIENGSKTIYDVVLPTPGFDVVYPSNEFKQEYEELMARDGINFQDMRRNIKEFSLAGSYRHIVSKPKQVEWWIKKYDSVNDQLVRTDLELLEQQLPLEQRIRTDIGENGPNTAVIIRMQLGTSQYATMALREAMKLDTSRRGDGMDVKSN